MTTNQSEQVKSEDNESVGNFNKITLCKEERREVGQMITLQCLGEEVRGIILSIKKLQFKLTLFVLFLYIVVEELNMLSPSVKSRVSIKEMGTDVVNIQSWFSLGIDDF